MINREDMLELTRRMTASRSSMTRIAGAYMDAEGFVDGSFNTNFLNLSASEKTKNIELAKAIPFAKENVQLKEYRIPDGAMKPGTIWHLLEAIKREGLKNDALMESFYELFGEIYRTSKDYAIFVFHDRYDVPIKGTDKERQGESEEVYEYLICSVFPVGKDYEPGTPEYGFLYPAFKERSADVEHILVYNQNAGSPHDEITTKLLGL